MEATERDEAVHGGVALVVAAQGGDREALDELVAAHLPLVYTIVRRALGGHADVDDVVQETMLRAVRDLPALRAPASFGAWLTSIAVRRVVDHHRRRIRSERTVVLDEELQVPDAEPALEDMSLLRLDVSEQRREVAEATAWLDPGDRLLLSLWWQETAGRMQRAEIATALGLSVAHTAVRIQRMREQLELARVVVAALADRSRCAGLAEVARKWDGEPGSVWRKRFVRHTRACPVCGRTGPARIPAERLLAGSALLVVPPGLAKTVAAGTATSAAAPSASWGGKLILAKLLGGHPVAAVVAVTAVAAVAVPAVVYRNSDPAPAPIAAPAPPATRAPAATAPPSRPAITPPSRTEPPATVLAPGRRLSLESVLGGYLTAGAGTGVTAADEARLTGVGPGSDAGTRRRATFVAVAGLADDRCYSFRTLDGRYLRHWELRTYTHRLEDSDLFRQDATFCPQPGAAAGAVMLEAHNYANQFLTWTGGHLLLRYNVGTPSFRADSSFRIRGSWAD